MKLSIILLVCIYISTPLASQQWNGLGPFVPPTGTTTIGQINCIAFNPFNPSRMFAGSPAGGLWVSSDAGANWLNAATDTLSVLGVSDIWVNPADSLNIVLALGDRDENASYILQGGGLYQTTDGGVSWSRSGEVDTSGSIYPVNNFRCSRVIRNTNTGQYFLATSAGLFSSTNFAANWNTRPYKEKVWDIKYRPNDFSIIYAVIGGRVYRSTNGGAAFTQATTGLPTTVSNRIQLAVTPANSSVVYALYVANDGSFGGLYKSNDAGNSWVLRSASPNILAAATDGSGSKGVNNCALAVSSTNENIVFAGGVNVWRSVDGGSNWTMSSHYLGNGAPLVSADIHELKFAPAPRSQYLYACTGSGVFVSPDTGRSWQNISNGLQVAQINRSAHHPVRDSLYLAATPTGVLRYLNNTWTKVSDSASTDVIFHPTQSNIAYMTTANGKLYRSKDTGVTFTDDIGPATAANGVAFASYIFNPRNYNTIYALLKDLWKTTNGGQTWTRTLNPFNASLIALTVSPKDTSSLYILTSDTLMYHSTNGGGEWRRAGRVQLQFPTVPRAVYASIDDANKVCVIGGRSISMTLDSGLTWNKYVVPASVYINCMYWKSDNCGEELVLGTSNGVYKLSSQFQFGIAEIFGSQMPFSPVNDLKLSGRYMRASTAGRGLYSAFVDDVGVQSDFSQDKTQICPGEFVQYYDQTKFGGLQTKWEFQGGTPPTSTESNPLVRFDSPGDHSVTLMSANGCGKDTLTRVSVNVIPKLKANMSLVKPAACVGDTMQINDISVGAGGTRDWILSNATLVRKTSTAIFAECTQTGKVTVSLTVSNQCGASTASQTFNVVPIPTKPTVLVVKDTLSVPDSSNYTYQWYANGSLLTSGNSHSWLGRFSGDYWVRVSNSGGCRVYSDTVRFVKTVDTTGTFVLEPNSTAFRLQPNPASDEVLLYFSDEWSGRGRIEFHDLLGNVVLTRNVDFNSSDRAIALALHSFADGVYIVEVHLSDRIHTQTFVKQR